MKHIFALVVLFSTSLLWADRDIETIYTDDKAYYTIGSLSFQQFHDQLAITLLKYNDYDLWALKGMDGKSNGQDSLMITFTKIEYSLEEALFFIYFDVNLIWPFGSKDSLMKFIPTQEYNNQGILTAITLTPILSTALVEEAYLRLVLGKDDGRKAMVTYESRIKLTPFIDLFFTLEAFKKNFEWYVFTMANNLKDYLN